MRLSERLNVLIQATTLSQKGGILTLDEAVKAKSAIDVISSGSINQNFASAINILIEIVVKSQRKGVYSLKDAYMIYLAVENIEAELQNEVNKVNEEMMKNNPTQQDQNNDEDASETIISVAPKTLKRIS